MNAKRMLVFLLGILPISSIHNVQGQMRDLWTSPSELAGKPMEGPAWQAVRNAANHVMLEFSVSEHLNNDRTNVNVLAAAIVAARTGDQIYTDRVSRAIDSLVSNGQPSGVTLAWGRMAGSYVLAADLIDYRTPEFESWLKNLATVWEGEDKRTLTTTFQRRPNNWGSHAFGTLAAIYAYLGDNENLSAIRDYWIQGVTGPNPGYKYGKDLSWHLNEEDPLFINPAGATKEGVNIDGFIPDDMRRGGSFNELPSSTNYVWESQQGLMMAARILDRVGMPIWDAADSALYRTSYAYQVRLGGVFQAENDDLWLLPFYDDAYGTNWAEGQSAEVWQAGKNAGFAYVLGGNTTIVGDFNGNGVLDVADIDQLSAAVFDRTNNLAFDLNSDGAVDSLDRSVWINDIKRTYVGDSDLDGEFGTGDLVQVFTSSHYEDGITANSTWATGDWNGDKEFDTADFVMAFQNGGFELGPRVASSHAVPEPTSPNSILVVFLSMFLWRLRNRKTDRKGNA